MNDFTSVAAVRGLAWARAAEAMLRALGGTEIRVLLHTGSAADADARQLGLDNPVVEAITLAPVVVRRAANHGRYEVLLAGLTVDQEAGQRQFLPQAMLAAAVGIEVGDLKLRVEGVATEYFGGAAYLYRVTAVEV